MTTAPSIRLRRYLRHGMLPQLAALEAVVRLGSATRAADALCVAQPTLSGHLRKLSDALGVRLFDLSGKRLVPTAAGLAVLEAAGDVWRALDRCERALTVWRPPAPASSDQRTARASGPAPDLEAPWDHAAPRAVENGPFP